MQLAVVLHADLVEQVELGFQEVDVTFLVLQQLLEQLHRNEIFVLAADLAGAGIGVAGNVLALEIALQHLFDVLADHQGCDVLQIGEALQEEDAIHELVGVVHLLDRFLALLLRKAGVAPVIQHAVMQPVLVDGAQLELEGLVQDVDDLFLAFHAASPCLALGSGCEQPQYRFLRHLPRLG